MPLGFPYNSLTLSPDGTNLVYVALVGERIQLWRRPMDGRQAQPIPNTDGAYVPFFSPDSRWVGFLADGKVKKAAIAGGAAEVLCSVTGETHDASWGTDGFVYFSSYMGLFRVPERGGVSEFVVDRNGQKVAIGIPTALPGGQHLVGNPWVRESWHGDFAPLGVYALATKTSSRLLERGHNPRFLPPGFLIFARGNGLRGVAFNPQHGKIHGESVLLVDGVCSSADQYVALHAFSSNGTLVYAAGGPLDQTTPAWVTREGRISKLPIAAKAYGEPRLSPDGRQFVVHVPDSQNTLWVFDTETGKGTKLIEPGANVRPIWLHDNRRLIFSSYRNEKSGLYLKDLARGETPAEQLLLSDNPKIELWPHACSPDAGSIVVQSINRSGDWSHFVLPLTGNRTPKPLNLPSDAWAIDFSSDGRWITYTSAKSGLLQVYIQRFPQGEDVQVSTEYGEEGFWSAKGDEIFYRHGDSWRVASITFDPSLKVGPPRVLFSGAFYNAGGYSYAVAPDGQRFLVFVPEHPSVPITQLEVITNWTAEVARKVAAGKSNGRKP
jgi:Tol biopolymer transport system component